MPSNPSIMPVPNMENKEAEPPTGNCSSILDNTKDNKQSFI